VVVHGVSGAKDLLFSLFSSQHLPDFEDLLRVVGGMGGDHAESLVGDGTGDDGRAGSATAVGGLEGSPDFENLLRVARGMGGDHDEGLLAGDGAADEGMVGDPAARIIGEIFEVFEGLGADGIEGVEGFVQARVLSGWLGHGGGFDGAGAVGGTGSDFGFAGWVWRIVGELGDAEAAEEVLLGEDHVFDAFQDGPVAGWRLAGSQCVVDSG
jgi:hypothetical protein